MSGNKKGMGTGRARLETGPGPNRACGEIWIEKLDDDSALLHKNQWKLNELKLMTETVCKEIKVKLNAKIKVFVLNLNWW